MARLKLKKPKITKSNQYWKVDFYFDGKRVRRFFKSKYEASDFVNNMKFGRVKSNIPQLKEMSYLKEFPADIKGAIRVYVNLISSKKSERNTEKKYFINFVEFICLELGIYLLRDIKTVHLVSYQDNRSTQVANSTVNREFSTIKHFFKKCLEWEAIEKDPSVFVTALPENTKTRELWSDDEINSVLSLLGPVMRKTLFFMAETGARNCEATGLRWIDVDFVKKQVVLRNQKGSKAKVRERFIPLSDGLFEVLRADREVAKSEWVFPGKHGGRQGRNSLTQSVRRVTDRLGLNGKTPYGLRHTMGTKLADRYGVDVAKEILGHAKLTTTQKYLHTSSERLKKAVAESSFRRIQPGNNGQQTGGRVLPFVAKK